MVQVFQRIAAEAAAARIAELLFGKDNKGGGFVDAAGPAIREALGFAYGGNPPVGVPSLVGERSPELIIPRAPMTVIPNSKFGGGTVTYSPTIVVQAPEGRISKATEMQISAATCRGTSRASNRNN